MSKDTKTWKFFALPSISFIRRNLFDPFDRFSGSTTQMTNRSPTSQAQSSPSTRVSSPPPIRQIGQNQRLSARAPPPKPPTSPQAINTNLSTGRAAHTSNNPGQYLLLCFNQQENIHLVHLNIPAVMNDQALFAKIRETYYQSRGWYKCLFSFKVLKRVEFVKVTHTFN